MSDIDLQPIPNAIEPLHEHVFEDRWYPLDSRHVRRVCVLPGCFVRQTKEV